MTSLNLHIPETFNTKTLRIEDNSIYDPTPPLNTILEIRPPSASQYVIFYLSANWKSETFDCEKLRLCYANCTGVQANLPDGIYDIRYSVDPNISTMVEYNHFRTTAIMKRYTKMVCSFFNKRSDYKKSEYIALMDRLIEIDFIIKAAKYKAEECLEKEEALALYDQASTLLKDFENEPCCS